MRSSEYPIRCISPADGGQYMHGFYNIQPWDRAERRLLAHRLPFIDRMPTGAEPAQLGLIDFCTRSFEPLAETYAWNFQLGCMAHWVESSDGVERVIYNDKRDKGFVSVLLELQTGYERIFSCPVFTVSRNGRFAFGYDFARLQPLRPGYAYPGVPYPIEERPQPHDEGVMCIDLITGETERILSYAQLADAFSCAEMRGATVFVSRLLCNYDDTRIVLSFRFISSHGDYQTCLATATFNGEDLHKLAAFDDKPAHFDWCGRDRLAVWLHPAGEPEGGFYLVEDRTSVRETLGRGVLTRDGHCSFGANTRLMLLDSFPDEHDIQHLLIFNRFTGELAELGHFAHPVSLKWGDLRCDLHPCWDRSGSHVCFDSMHEGRRAIYTVEADSHKSPPNQQRRTTLQ